MYKRILKNSAIYGLLPQLSKIASFFVLPLTTPFLTGQDYGIIGVLSAYIGAFSIFHLLGFNVVVTNAFYHYPKQYKWYWRQTYGFLMLWSVVFIALLGLIIYYTLPNEARPYRWVIIAAKTIPLLLFGASDMLAGTYYRLNHNAWPIASRSLLAGFAGVALSYYFIAHLRLGYMGWIWSEFITSMFNGLLFLFPVLFQWKIIPIFNFKRRLIKKALKVSLPVVPHSYGSYLLNSSDRAVMERLNVSTQSIGLYSLAYNFGAYINTIANAMNQAIGPNLIELIKKGRWKEYEKLIFGFQTFVVFICFTLALWIPQWLPFLVRNKELLQINYLLAIIIMSYSFKPIYIGCNQVVFYFEKTSVLWRITFIAGIANVVLNLIFIPIFGITAAAVNTFVSLAYMAFAGFSFNHFKAYNKARLYPMPWLLFVIFFLGVALFFVSSNLLTKMLIQLFFITLLITGFLGFSKYQKKSKTQKIALESA
ncbi:lipopolysaccharide biosynthesis protein [Paracnuella aquatica]|uniref:lipopolysaccharide biosynthesis protein n=1 Tax=Paracnuella aquatica TaxID=2268757 RepID=UPI000DEF643C|nr:oligosaccharide flippase family protein [Paracnuella aquatica]RPD45525.1 lipopolysaccharide biosynthesis protein [Paracnuella aquatica]